MPLPYDEIIAEAERFILKARKARDAKAVDEYETKNHASAKRASMDLTRALTEFRRGN